MQNLGLGVMVIGSGGREFEMVRKLAESPLTRIVYCAPGNVGMKRLSKVECVNIKAEDIPALVNYALENKIDFTVPGPEGPLVKGIVDAFETVMLRIFGPSQKAAMLEGSKVDAKQFMFKYDIPTAPFTVSVSTGYIRKYLVNLIKRHGGFPVVLKVDGLAGGKGVKICKCMQDVLDFLDEVDAGKFKGADGRIIMEDCLIGEEASYIVMVDKNGNVRPWASSQDHKAVRNNDEGPNTGGTGAYSPAPVVTKDVENKILGRIIYPTVRGMWEEGMPLAGFLYAGLMIKDGDPWVLEYNARLGDPETQPILARMKSDFAELILAAHNGRLDEYEIEWDEAPAVCVVKMAEGYPETPVTGDEITGIEGAEGLGAIISLAGVTLNDAGKIVTASGRVVGITARGASAGDFAGAKRKAYFAASKIHFRGEHFRTDIADRAINRQK